jgi:CysZ protein
MATAASADDAWKRLRSAPMQGSISDGLSYFMRGFGLLRNPRLLPFVVIPLLINIVIFASLISYSISTIGETLGIWLSVIPDWLSWLDWLIWPIVVIVLALVTGYLFTAVAILIASPFNALLAEKVEELTTGQPVQGPEGLWQALLLFPRAITRELVKLLYYLPLLLVVLVLMWIPPFTAVTPLLWFLFGAWMMAVQYTDYPMDNHQISFAGVKDLLRQRRLSSLGFGGAVALASGVPILNFFVVPAAVCGATLFWCEELARLRRPHL